MTGLGQRLVPALPVRDMDETLSFYRSRIKVRKSSRAAEQFALDREESAAASSLK